MPSILNQLYGTDLVRSNAVEEGEIIDVKVGEDNSLIIKINVYDDEKGVDSTLRMVEVIVHNAILDRPLEVESFTGYSVDDLTFDSEREEFKIVSTIATMSGMAKKVDIREVV